MTTIEASTDRSSAVRFVGIDIARFVAIAGMIGAHLQLGSGPDWTAVPLSGFPSTAFAVIGGISAVLATRRYTERGEHLAAAVALIARGLIVAVIGVLLSLTPTFVIVVLVYFGAGLVCLAPLLRLPIPLQAGIAAALAIGGPALNVLVRDSLGQPDPDRIDLRSPLHAVASVLFTGTYPVVTWLAYLLVGAIVGRLLVRATEPVQVRVVAVRIALVGALTGAAAVVADALSGPRDPTARGGGAPLGEGWRFWADASPHSGSLGDMARTGGVAVLAVGLLLLAGPRLSAASDPVRPFAAAGAAALTVYSAHVLATAVFPFAGTAMYVLNLLGVLAIGAALAAAGRRGPLERLTTAGARRAADWVGRLSRARPSPSSA